MILAGIILIFPYENLNLNFDINSTIFVINIEIMFVNDFHTNVQIRSFTFTCDQLYSFMFINIPKHNFLIIIVNFIELPRTFLKNTFINNRNI